MLRTYRDGLTLDAGMTNRPPPTTQTRPGTARRGFGVQAVVSLVTAILLIPWCMRAAAEDSAARVFAAHALELRSAGVAGEARAAAVLADMPGVPLTGAEASLPVLWASFFENAIVKLGRVQSDTPAALYYNPLLDIAVFTVWERRQGRYRVASIRALPGEHLTDPEAAVTTRPPWMAEGNGPLDALSRITTARLDGFRRAHPASAWDARRDATTFAAAAAGLRAALPRLAWNAVRRAQWAEEPEPWLDPVLSGIERALAAHDASTLLVAAPDTDAETAAVLAELPDVFTERLTLDMVLGAGGEERLLIGSVPEDGDIYVLALCRLDGGGACALRRFLLVSLLD